MFVATRAGYDIIDRLLDDAPLRVREPSNCQRPQTERHSWRESSLWIDQLEDNDL